MTRIPVLAAVLVAAVAITASASSMSQATTLKGTVGPGYTISLKSSTGAPVKTLKASSYTFIVTDKSSSHSFHLRGPGVNKALTTIGGKGTKTVTLTLKPGKYTFFCEAHPTTMHGSFTVS